MLGGKSHGNVRRINEAETDQHLAELIPGAVLLQEPLDKLLLTQQPALDKQSAQGNRPPRAGAPLVRR